MLNYKSQPPYSSTVGADGDTRPPNFRGHTHWGLIMWKPGSHSLLSTAVFGSNSQVHETELFDCCLCSFWNINSPCIICICDYM